MAFQRVPKAEIGVEQKGDTAPYSNVSSMRTTLKAIQSDPKLHRHETIYEYLEPYRQQGVDLQKWYEAHATTTHRDEIKNAFLKNKHHSEAAELAETLPLFANTEGRLGENIRVTVTKTAKQDDQGNSFIDLVIEVHNTWLATDAPKYLQNAPAKMTFLVDMTTADDMLLEKKINAFRNNFLLYGKKANVKCYKNEHGTLGIERAKVVVTKQSDYIEKTGSTLGDCLTQTAGDKFLINKPEKFDEQYRAYFMDLMTAIGENAQANIVYMKSLVPDPKRTLLIHEYEKMIAFVEAYKKTPLTRTKRTA